MSNKSFLSRFQFVAFTVLLAGLFAWPDSAEAQRRGGRGLFGGDREEEYDEDDEEEYDEEYDEEPVYRTRRFVETPAPVAQPVPQAAPVAPVAFQETAELLAPKDNSVPTDVVIADSAVARKVGAELDGLLIESVRKLTESTRESTLTDVAREEFCSKYLTAEMDPVLTKSLRNALIDFDAESAELNAKKLGLPGRAIESVLPQTRLGGMMHALEKLVRSEDSVDKVDAFARRFQTSARDFDLDRAQREQVMQTVEAILESLRIRLALTERPKDTAGSMIAAPEGQLPAIMYPPLMPAGRLYLVGGGVLVVGKGQPGPISVARARAIELLDLPRGSGEPIAAVSADAARKQQISGTVVYNPLEHDKSVRYSINGTQYTVKPGESQVLPATTTWVIAFDQGNKKQARYTLGEGCYAFTEKEGVLNLQLKPCNLSIENPSSSGELNFVVDNQHVAIPAGQSVALNSKYPIIIGFHQGPGGEVLYKKLWGGKYQFALQTKHNLWDLYALAPATKVTGPPAAAK